MASSKHIDTSLAPYHCYKKLVLAGSRYHNLPPEYVAVIESVRSIEDPDIHRRQKNEELLHQMAGLDPASGFKFFVQSIFAIIADFE